MRTNGKIIAEAAHLMAGPIARRTKTLTILERSRLEAARIYISAMLEQETIARTPAEIAAMSAWNNWRAQAEKVG